MDRLYRADTDYCSAPYITAIQENVFDGRFIVSRTLEDYSVSIWEYQQRRAQQGSFHTIMYKQHPEDPEPTKEEKERETFPEVNLEDYPLNQKINLPYLGPRSYSVAYLKKGLAMLCYSEMGADEAGARKKFNATKVSELRSLFDDKQSGSSICLKLIP